MGIYGVIGYTIHDEEFFILLALGALLFIPGFAFTVRAAAYLLSWKSFLRSANLTKCNVFYFVKIQKCRDIPYRGEVSRYYFAYYTLKVCYIDNSSQRQMKTVKYLTARNLATKMSSYFIPEGDKYSLYGECVSLHIINQEKLDWYFNCFVKAKIGYSAEHIGRHAH